MITRLLKREGKSRSDITETVERSSRDMDDKLGDLDTIRGDVITVRDTRSGLDFGGTEEGNDLVDESFEEAESSTIDVYDQEDDQMDGIQAENEEYEGQLQQYSDTDESDLGKVSDASARIKTDITVNKAIAIKNRILEDIDFLISQQGDARDAREESESTQQDYRGQVHSGSSGRRR